MFKLMVWENEGKEKWEWEAEIIRGCTYNLVLVKRMSGQHLFWFSTIVSLKKRNEMRSYINR